MLTLRNVQMAARSYQNLYGYNYGGHPYAENGTQDIAVHLYQKGYIEKKLFDQATGLEACAGGGTYTCPTPDIFPHSGQLYLKCSLSATGRSRAGHPRRLVNSPLGRRRIPGDGCGATMDYREAIDWLFSTQMFGIKLGLDGSRRLLKEFLAYPAPRHTKVIHVAGTNGKGSTCAMIDSIARACGRRTGLFTSPHLIDYRERIKVSGQEIPEETCAAMLTALREICERFENHPTFFEISARAGHALVPRARMRTHHPGNRHGRQARRHHRRARRCLRRHPHRLDHMQWLGETLEAIAAEKAGIFVTGKPIISAPQEPAARFVLEKEANETRAPHRVHRRTVC